MKQKYFSGTSVIIGKPNVGKSTIINKLINSKISIVSKKKHTTQSNITGIMNIGLQHQLIYIDTPGISKKYVYKNQNKTFRNTMALMHSIQFIFLILEKTSWTNEDEYILNIVKKYLKPIFAIINKIDKIKSKEHLLPHILTLSKKHMFQEIIPISGKTGENIHILSKVIQNKLKIVPKPTFPFDLKTNLDIKSIVSEIIREKLILYLGDELPYSIQVSTKNIIDRNIKTSYIEAVISVNNTQHKKIIIGCKGKKIKLCGSLARKALEKFFNKSIYLSLKVIKKNKTL
ncbi:GTP-binding protein era-like protein [Buchnera aphidicola str. Bp (Baizongia pistaciae)]|uniref:GTPase Era n=1 Tax=Buchnera aphidicola subsp. Baizongia pistaciae (strain Bp) TaxID=224915 RepID=ERA_BUCBP|nr:GTPase Era [Buchnera aphidicola]Q89AM7.1 RecName: Full=GTPase Era [Buchnera aphidicola str. Bp (Baizongia pistaciae)]AAO26965.1 GTP-binding protein era-like protein [Buchnera aphidicola str. Bp (Baizongia pistaciae)]